jgi:hypothetical protein
VDGSSVVSSGGDSEPGIDREVDDVNADLAEVKHEHGGCVAVRYLIERGHRRVLRPGKARRGKGSTA